MHICIAIIRMPHDHLEHFKNGSDLANPTEVNTEFYTNKMDQLIAQCTKAQLVC